MKIRPLTTLDIAAILLIEKENYDDPWDYKIFEDEIVHSQNSEYYGIFNDEELIGYMGFWKLPDYLDITNISVKPQYKRQGIAKKLLDYLEACAQSNNINSIFLEVNVNNQGAIKLYEDYGYKILKTIRHYYSYNNDDAYLMQKELSNE